MFNVKLHGLSDGLHAVFTFYMAPAYKHDSEYVYDEESNDIKTVGGYYKPQEGLPIVMKLSDLVLGPRNFEQNLDIIFKFDSGVFSGTTTIQSLFVAALYVHRDIPALPDEEVINLLYPFWFK